MLHSKHHSKITMNQECLNDYHLYTLYTFKQAAYTFLLKVLSQIYSLTVICIWYIQLPVEYLNN